MFWFSSGMQAWTKTLCRSLLHERLSRCSGGKFKTHGEASPSVTVCNSLAILSTLDFHKSASKFCCEVFGSI